MLSLLRYIDKTAGSIIVFILLLFKKDKSVNDNHKRILVIKLWALGDSVLSLTLIRGIKESYKNCSVDVLILPRVKDIFESYDIDNILYLNSLKDLQKILKKSEKYDIVFDCEPYLNISAIMSFLIGKHKIGFGNQYRSKLYNHTIEFRKDQHMVQNYLDMLRSLDKDYDTNKLEELLVPEAELQKMKKYIEDNFSNENIIGICPGISESSKNRMWFEDRFAELADLIITELDCRVLFIDSDKNRKVTEKIMSLMKCEAINTIGEFNLKETFSLISKCRIFISNDTGPMHIAAAQGCKTIGLFGPNTPVLWAPYGDGNIAIYKTKLEPCIQNDKGVFKNKNRMGYMGPIEVDDVFNTVKDII
ncbi:MAG TPA: glycosyltransferase family 9 protein [Bacteroidales bacterium]|nr:glycosyltransferase family 9 protein [Bacteroidales bacterium]